MKKNVYSSNTASPRLHEPGETPSRSGFMGRRTLLKAAAGLGVVGVGAGTLIGGTSWMKKAFAAYAPPTGGGALYDGMAAAAWADKYAVTDGTDYSQQTQGGDNDHPGGDDCTNFVSNCMYQGGQPMDNQWFSREEVTYPVTGDPSSPIPPLPITVWVYGNPGYHPWTVAPDLYDYLTNKTDYGVTTNIFHGPQKGKMPRNGLVPGDLIFYSWLGDGQINHVAIMSTPGRGSNNQLFDQADEHTSNRKQVFWSLEDFWADSGLVPDNTKVTMYCVHINTNTALYTAG
jgi:cell wall-associated NlpC family hydrolase